MNRRTALIIAALALVLAVAWVTPLLLLAHTTHRIERAQP